LLSWAFSMPWVALLASLTAAIAAFVVAGHATAVRHRGQAGLFIPVGLLAAAALTPFWDFSTSGLEMGLVWLWIATCWVALVSVARSETITGRQRLLSVIVIGAGVLVRPDLGLMMVCFAVAWFVLVRPRRIVHDLAWMFALPLLYQIFRMGYYAALVPTT